MTDQPTAGEWELLEFLDRELDNSFEVYYTPFLNGLRPDVVVVRKCHGVLVIEVKDYELSGGWYERKDFKEWRATNGKDAGVIRSPFYQAKQYKDALYDLHCRVLSSKRAVNTNYYSVVTAGVFFSRATEAEIKAWNFHDERDPNERYIACWGRDALASADRFFRSLPYLFSKESRYFDDEIYEEITRVLTMSDDMLQQLTGKQVSLTKEQHRLAESKPCHEAKIRGVAGSGKTEVIAHLAVNAYKRTREPVLIVMFNITLRNYIQDRIRTALGEPLGKRFIIIHYHALAQYYKERKYTTILVDEVQDFEREWIEGLRNKWLDRRTDNWEIVFFGDEKQNIYERAMEQDDQEERGNRPYTGVRGQWNQLKTSFRLEGHIADVATAFERAFESNKDDVDTILVQDNMFDDSKASYYRLNRMDEEAVYQLYHRVIHEAPLPKRPNDNDVVIIGTRVAPMRALEHYLRCRRGYQTSTTFETEEKYREIAAECKAEAAGNAKAAEVLRRVRLHAVRRPIKFKFRPMAGQLKLSTIHSFKGWGMETVFLIIDNTVGEWNSCDEEGENNSHITTPLLYTALTRAIRRLIIIEIGEGPYTQFFQHYFYPRRESAMKHIALLFLSDVHTDSETKRITASTYHRADGSTFTCKQTNESAVVDMAERLQQNGEAIDAIFYFASKKTRSPFEYVDDDGTLKQTTAARFFEQRVALYTPHCEAIEYDEDGETAESIQQVLAIADEVKAFLQRHAWELTDVRLHADFTGGPRHASMMMLSVMQLLKYSGIQTDEVVYSNWQGKRVENMTDIYRMFNVISGADEFVNFGSIKEIETYLQHEEKTPQMTELLQAMKDFTNTVRICRTGNMKQSAQRLQQAITAFETSQTHKIS